MKLKDKLKIRGLVSGVFREHIGFTVLIGIFISFLVLLWHQYFTDMESLGELAFCADKVTLGIGMLIISYLHTMVETACIVLKSNIKYETVKICAKHYEHGKMFSRDVYRIKTDLSCIHGDSIKVSRDTFMNVSIGSEVVIAALDSMNLDCADYWHIFKLNLLN